MLRGTSSLEQCDPTVVAVRVLKALIPQANSPALTIPPNRLVWWRAFCSLNPQFFEIMSLVSGAIKEAGRSRKLISNITTNGLIARHGHFFRSLVALGIRQFQISLDARL